MQIKQLLAVAIKVFLKIFLGKNPIVNKPFRNSTLRFYYNPLEHLNFLFKNRIFYENNIQSKIQKYINNNDLIFDIGANIGQYSLFFSNTIGINSGKVICIEPDCNNFGYLCLNKYINNRKNIYLVNKGVGATICTSRLFIDSITGGRKSSFVKTLRGEGNIDYEVEVTTLSELVITFGVPNFVKIDVEGYEDVIISSIDSNISLFLNTFWLIEVRANTKYACFSKFSNTHICVLMESNSNEPIDNAIGIPDFGNLLFIPANKWRTSV